MTNVTPQLRFPEFTDEWRISKIDEIFKINAGGDIEKLDFSKSKNATHKYPVYANALTAKGLVGYSAKPRVTTKAVTVTGRGDIGHALAREAGFSAVVRLLILTSDNEYSPYFFECAINKTKLFTETTGVPQLTAPQLGWYKVSYPKPEEQQKIADFLTAVDDKISALEQKAEKLEAYKRGVMQKIFTRRIRFTRPDGSPYPEWEKKKFGDIGRVAMCKRIFNSETKETGGVPFYKIGTFGKKPDAYISETRYEEYKAKYPFPRAGDILLSASGTIGRMVVYDGKPAYFQDSNIIWLKHDDTIVTNEYLQHIYPRINWITESGTIQRLYNDNFLNTQIIVPTLEEQQKIADFLSAIDQKITLTTQQLEKTKEFKKGLLRRMFV